MSNNLVIKNEVLDCQVLPQDIDTQTKLVNFEDSSFILITFQIISINTEDFIIYETIKKQLSLIQWQQQEIFRLTKQLKKRTLIETKYASTKEASFFINVDPSFLAKRQGTIFKLGIHFFKPAGQSIVRWDLEALEEWIRAKYIDHNIDEELAELLERR